MSAHAHHRLCPFMGAGRRSWCMVTVLAGGGSHTSSCVGDGEGHRWASPLVRSGLVVVVVACVPSWALGISCGRWQLVVVVLGWGGRFRAVIVVFVGGPCRHGRMTCWGMWWLVTWLATLLLLSLVVVVSRWRWWWAVAAVGDGGDMAGLGCFRRWWWCVVVVAIWVCGRSVFVAVGGRCGRSLLFAVWAVVVGRRVCWWGWW